MSDVISGFVHIYDPGSQPITLVLLHGTGGDESDLLPLGRSLLPEAHLLSPRGKVLESGMPRFFRRLTSPAGEIVFDLEDLARRTAELAEFIEEAAARYDITDNRVVAVGYSNGANIAGSLLLEHPEILDAAALLHPMVPFEPKGLPDLGSRPILITAGERDPIVPRGQPARLAQILEEAGAQVDLAWQAGGHELGMQELGDVRSWIEKVAV